MTPCVGYGVSSGDSRGGTGDRDEELRDIGGLNCAGKLSKVREIKHWERTEEWRTSKKKGGHQTKDKHAFWALRRVEDRKPE